MVKNSTKMSTWSLVMALLFILCTSVVPAPPSMHSDGPAVPPDNVPPPTVIKGDSSPVLYAIADGGPSDSQIFAIGADNSVTPIGPIHVGFDLEAIDISPITGRIFTISGEDGDQDGKLWELNPNPPHDLTFVAQTTAIGTNEIMSGSFHPNGEFWAFQQHVGIVKVDLTNGNITVVWPAVPGINNFEGLAWDTTGTFLYGSMITHLFRWNGNPADNPVELCAGDGGGLLPDQTEALDVRPSDNVLFGGMSELEPANMRIFRIDTALCTLSPSGYPTGDFFDIETMAFVEPTGECTGVIGDFVWNDLNGDGLQNFGEPGIPNVTVVLKDAGNIIRTDTTDANGLYLFEDVCQGSYTVEVTAGLPAGFVPSPCLVGADDEIDNNCSPAPVTLPDSKTTNLTIDFGYNCGCDDGNPCTIDICDPECSHKTTDCEDGNACTTDSCDPQTGCRNSAIDCRDTNVCTEDFCNPLTGCVNEALNCDDGNACTEESCDPASGCVRTTIDCTDENKCTNDRCNPVSGCERTALDCDDKNICTNDSCDPESGCVRTALDCHDTNKCTNDSCNPESGCVNTALDCNDTNACTEDTCNPASGCAHTTISCNDSNKCTNDSCNPASGCVNTVLDCSDGNACTNDSCDPASGCVRTTLDCNDENKCTNDSCNPASGCVRTLVDCSDGNKCTNDSCNPESGCVRILVDCNDHNKCTNDSCNRESGCVNTLVNCNDNNACTADSCNPDSGCVNTPISCNDNTICTADSCDPASGCVNTPTNCNDGNTCTTDSCNPTSGCVNTVRSCDDGDSCTQDSCNPTTGCVNTPVGCNDGNACTTDICSPTGGCTNTPRSCDDGNPCTTDSCNPTSGCVNTPTSCNDHNPCTDDTCHPTKGCVNSTRNCNDGNACTTDSCNPNTGACANTPISCNDGDPCTDDSCDPASGCVNTPGEGGGVCIPRNGGTIPGGSLGVTVLGNGDVEVLFIQTVDVNDNSYGTNIVNWPRSHSFSSLRGSDRAQFVFTNGLGNVVFDFSVDYISEKSGTPSGFASLGLAGGDGRLTTGQGSWLLSFETSLQKNLNNTGYCTGGNCTVSGVNLLVNSPPTNPPNTSYNVPPAFNQWIFPITYKVVVSHLAFGASGFGSVSIPYVHNSPPKFGDNATPFEPCPCPPPCNDNNPCTDDTRNASGQCVNTPNTAPCSDGDPCSTGDRCSDGACVPGSTVCDDTNPCTIDTCEEADDHSDDHSDADDVADCFHRPKDCDDHNKCTTDSCDPATGACVNTPISCNDNLTCTTDTCDPAVGCVHTPNCNDNNACTRDTCSPTEGSGTGGGRCVYTPIACGDYNPCTIDTCNPASGCVHTPKSCNDNNPCTTDTCNPNALGATESGSGGCVNVPKCNDNNKCTIDTCSPTTGACKSLPKSCDDFDPCTTDNCHPSRGCTHIRSCPDDHGDDHADDHDDNNESSVIVPPTPGRVLTP